MRVLRIGPSLSLSLSTHEGPILCSQSHAPRDPFVAKFLTCLTADSTRICEEAVEIPNFAQLLSVWCCQSRLKSDCEKLARIPRNALSSSHHGNTEIYVE